MRDFNVNVSSVPFASTMSNKHLLLIRCLAGEGKLLGSTERGAGGFAETAQSSPALRRLQYSLIATKPQTTMPASGCGKWLIGDSDRYLSMR